MKRPLQVTFRNMAVSSVLEEEVLARSRWLETFCPEIIGCRVLFEVPHRHRAAGRPVHIRIELSVPGDDIIVRHRPTKPLVLRDLAPEIRTDAPPSPHKDIIAAIHDAFDVARRRLEDQLRRRRARKTAHRSPSKPLETSARSGT
jgi:ribosome-associated translation inhibitor RaiA